jgi:hypothetical protein
MLPLLLLSSPAFAADGQLVRLVWIRGEGAAACASQATVQARVTERLGRDPFSDDAPRVLEVVVGRAGERWTARIAVREVEGRLVGERQLGSEAADCAPLEAAATLAIALTIDPEAALRSEPRAPAPASVPPIPRSPLTPPPPRARPCPPSKPCPEPPRGMRGSVTVRGALVSGLVPGLRPALELAGDVEVISRVHVTGGALWLPEARARDTRFAFGMTAFSVGACVDLLVSRESALAACSRLHAGAVHAVPYSLEPVEPGSRAWVGLGAGPRWAIDAGPVRLELGVEALVPLARYDFRVVGLPGSVFRQSAVGGLGFVGAGASFP